MIYIYIYIYMYIRTGPNRGCWGCDNPPIIAIQPQIYVIAFFKVGFNPLTATYRAGPNGGCWGCGKPPIFLIQSQTLFSYIHIKTFSFKLARWVTFGVISNCKVENTLWKMLNQTLGMPIWIRPGFFKSWKITTNI